METVTDSFPFPAGYDDLERYLSDLVEFYRSPLVRKLSSEVHILNFLLSDSDLFEAILPIEWVSYLDDTPLDASLSLIININESSEDNIPASLVEFLDKIKSFAMHRKPDNENKTSISLEKSALSLGMSPKKLHECAYLSEAVAKVCNKINSTNIIDLGSGKGYLSRTLAYEYGFSVVAIENVESRKEGAERLDELYDRKGGKRRVLQEVNGSGSLVHMEKFVDNGNLSDVVEKADMKGESITLVGLHTCGNLSHHALRSLIATKEISAVAVVGCCYNLMTERAVDKDDEGFPLSRKLESYSIPMPTSARMLACQAPATWTRKTRDAFFKRHFYRALLQRIYLDRGFINPEKVNHRQDDRIQVGSLRKQWYKSFAIYCQGASRRVRETYGMKYPPEKRELLVVSEDVATVYIQKYNDKYKRLAILWTLMATAVGSLTEALIHLDRLFFIKEQGAKEAYVSVVFDQEISARNLMVVGIK
ncbi:methyltransferase domain-containing protein [Dipodascopsis uninucleata]